ncbi:hypothetical protein WR25_14652 [Diploscapter pachys]|uniref:tRNA (carboxymethyluridine(34)-5-O)-methyltransferase n=1 Tax=Diploscapter pachys TaxID=2018661 RepID=A0A2A2LJF6_9BILA|nr:hypothetical protein WR25_14652 [Diploscapter pachys]
MYFNDQKERRLGEKLDGPKLRKRLGKSLEQLKRHDPSVEVADKPTQILFVGNSSVMCGVSLEELEEIFTVYDGNCQFIVYPNKRTYSFVQFSSVEQSQKACDELNGYTSPVLKTSHLPFVIAYVENLPQESIAPEFRPKDLEIIDDFVNEETEQAILDVIYSNPKAQSMKHRAVVHYGHEFDYGSNAAFKPTDPIPDLFDKLIDRFVQEGYIKERPDQITANIYKPGDGIPSHYDTHSAFENEIISLSLCSDVVMDFKDGANSATIAPVLLKGRSLCIIKGESRYRWKHGIVNRNNDVDPRSNRVVARKLRVSLTFRKIRTQPCQCSYKEFCDWDREGEMCIPSTANAALKLEQTYVADVYENIAAHFNETRHSNWRAVQNFINSLPRYSVLYDVGCGNGKYLAPKDDLIKIGCDMCMGLCKIAAGKNTNVIRADALHLPFHSAADAVICIAVLHHMSSFERRQIVIREILRVLKPGGRACLTVWSMDQSDSEYSNMRKNKEESNELCELTREAKRLRIHDGKQFTQQDLFVPWVSDEKETYLRYYHIFRDGELEELLGGIDGCQLESITREQGNYVVIFKKIK